MILPLVLVSLAACVTAPVPVVVAPDNWISARQASTVSATGLQTFGVTSRDGQTEREASAVEAVRDQLLAKGWQEAGEAGAWQVDVAYAERPARYGLYSDETAREGEWAVAPHRTVFWSRGRQTYSLEIILKQTARPADPVTSRARMRAKAGRGAELLPVLAAAVVEPLTP